MAHERCRAATQTASAAVELEHNRIEALVHKGVSRLDSVTSPVPGEANPSSIVPLIAMPARATSSRCRLSRVQCRTGWSLRNLTEPQDFRKDDTDVVIGFPAERDEVVILRVGSQQIEHITLERVIWGGNG